jgi:uncharacterized protein YggE
MIRPIRDLTPLFLAVCIPFSSANAQLGGSRAGVEAAPAGIPDLPPADRKVVESYIAIEGRAEVRVSPSEVRIVLAVTSEGTTAAECQRTIDSTIDQLRTDWNQLGISPNEIVEDFIAVLPLYQWDLEKRGDADVGVEKKAGFRMQTNVHLAVPNDDTPRAALKVAFKHGVSDIIAFDYWSPELDEIKRQARDKAIHAAREKSAVLLDAVFEERPRVINLQEQTTVRYPASQYHSFENTLAENVIPSWRRETTLIRAFRPRNTYYRGLDSGGDVQPRELPMQPEISVVSTVRLYYESPAATRVSSD